MIERYRAVARRIRLELAELEKTVNRAERAMIAAQSDVENQDLFLDSAALNLHDFYTGLERIFSQIAKVVDNSMPSGQNWHRDLLNQMGKNFSQLRPRVLSVVTIQALDEYRRFRHVVRNVYAFEFDAIRVEPLIESLRSSFTEVQSELLAFAELLEQLADES